jgi:SAM-dependent methyltransferase
MSVGPEYFDDNYFKYVIYNGTPYGRETAGRMSMNWALSLFANYNPDNLLDVGCGYGYLIEAMRLGGCWAIGVDWSDHCIKKAAAEGNKFLTMADVRDGLPQFENNQFSIVTAFGLLDRIELNDLNKAVASIVRVAQQPILLEIAINKDDQHPDMSGVTGDLSLCSVYSLGFWQKLFRNHECVMFEGNFDKPMTKVALLFMKQQTPRKAFETMNEMRLRQIFLKLGIHEDKDIKSKDEFEKLTREQIIEFILEKNDQLIKSKKNLKPHQLIEKEEVEAPSSIKTISGSE